MRHRNPKSDEQSATFALAAKLPTAESMRNNPIQVVISFCQRKLVTKLTARLLLRYLDTAMNAQSKVVAAETRVIT